MLLVCERLSAISYANAFVVKALFSLLFLQQKERKKAREYKRGI